MCHLLQGNIGRIIGFLHMFLRIIVKNLTRNQQDKDSR